ncbi:MAG: ATP-binding protein [Chloroflexota bacterium]
MSLTNQVVAALQTQAKGLSEEKIQQVAAEIARRIESQSDLAVLPAAMFTQELVRLSPTIQIMVAENNSTIQDAAQYAFQVLLTQVVDDPRSTIPAQYQDDQQCPYPGLTAFSEADAGYFYGREAEIETLLQMLNRPLVALTGSSGVGKSSFIFAGVLPRLKAQYGATAVFLTFRMHSDNDLLAQFCRLFKHRNR